MAEAGIGVDIVEIARVESILAKTPSFAKRVFTEEERLYCESTARPAAHYACRFAAREAVLKALGTGFSAGIGRFDVSVSRDQNGRPTAVLANRALEIAQEQGVVEMAISLSFTGDLAIANAMAITEEARPKPKEDKEDERARIARSFREARSVLDELERVQIDDVDAATEAPAVTEAPVVTKAPAVAEAPVVTEADAATEAVAVGLDVENPDRQAADQADFDLVDTDFVDTEQGSSDETGSEH